MAIDWNRGVVVVSDEQTVNIIAGKTILYVMNGGSAPELLPEWGNIEGDIKSQSDLQTALAEAGAGSQRARERVTSRGGQISLAKDTKLYDVLYEIPIVQSGSGSPSASNIRPFVGVSGCVMKVYNGSTLADSYNCTFSGTYYQGVFDSLTGTIRRKWMHVASYNGETIPITGHWFSDRDVSSGSNVPTTGAEVMIELEDYIEETVTYPPKWEWQSTFTDTLGIAVYRSSGSAMSSDDIAVASVEMTVTTKELMSWLTAPQFDNTKVYASGNCVMKDGGFFRFIKAHNGAWAEEDVEQTTIYEELVRRTS